LLYDGLVLEPRFRRDLMRKQARKRGDHPSLTKVEPENPGSYMFRVDFPPDGSGKYQRQTHVRMPMQFAVQLGLDGDWGFALKPDPDNHGITHASLFVQVTDENLRSLPLFEVLFPHSGRQRLQNLDGMAIGLVEIHEEVDLLRLDGRITVLLSEVNLQMPLVDTMPRPKHERRQSS
jgi:hypothetical protein